jgi:hypothetical protein
METKHERNGLTIHHIDARKPKLFGGKRPQQDRSNGKTRKAAREKPRWRKIECEEGGAGGGAAYAEQRMESMRGPHE